LLGRPEGQGHDAGLEGLSGDQRQRRFTAVAELRQPGAGQDRVDREPEAGDWRMLAVAANGQPAAAAYHREPDGSYHAYGIVVLTATVTGIARLVVFADPGLFRWFGLPQIRGQ
jgi:hypothetical protein